MQPRSLQKRKNPQNQLQEAIKHHQEGQLEKAEDIYKKILKLERENADAWHLLGLLNFHKGNWQQAVKFIKRAVEYAPNFVDALNNLAIVLCENGQLAESISYYQRAIKIKPNFVEAIKNLGNVYNNLGQVENAITLYQRALEIKPGYLDAINNLANIYNKLDKKEEAITLYKRALDIDQNSLDALNNLGTIYTHQAKLEEAIALFRRSLEIAPNLVEGLNNLGYALGLQEKIDEAIEYYQRALELKPDYLDVLNNLGNALSFQRKFEQTLEIFQKILDISPDNLQVLNSLANSYIELKEYSKAQQLSQKVLEIDPKDIDALNHLGNIYAEQGRPNEAIKYYQKTLQIKPDYVTAHWNLAINLLLTGDLPRGLAEYEIRFDVPRFKAFHPPTPMWRGESLTDKSIVIWNEQAFGDYIQFIRYALILNQKGAKVTIAVPKSLLELFKETLLEKFIVVDKLTCNLLAFDYHVSVMSLPHIMRTATGNIPHFKKYIFEPTTKRPHWSLKSSNNYKVGIVWASDKKNIKLYSNKHAPIEHFISLLAIENLNLYSLQVGEDAEQIKPWLENTNIENLSPLIDDFLDTAGLIAQLDLVITIDTSVAHLAGAMGKPVWVLLSYVPDWRWFLERDDSPWYSSMRLFRQTRAGDWEGVFGQVKRKLKRVVQGESPLLKLVDSGLIAHKLSWAIQFQEAANNLSAEKLYREILELQPDNIHALSNLGLLLSEQDSSFIESISILKQAFELDPRNIITLNNLGNVYAKYDYWQDAHYYYQLALDIEPDFVDVIYNRGIAFNKQEKYDQAQLSFARVLELNPNFAPAYSDLGNSLLKQEKLEEALQCYQKSIEIQPDYVDAIYNLGFALAKAGRIEEAICSYQRALQIDPNYMEAHWNLGNALLLLGDLANGFVQYERRFEVKKFIALKAKTAMWDGTAELKDCTIVIWNEQGLGDSIQFVRYAYLLQEKGARVILSVHPSLTRLYQLYLSQKFEVIDNDKCDVYAQDYHVSLMSLPAVLKTRLDTIPNFPSYINAPEPRSKKHKLTCNNYRIGIAWASDKKNIEMYKKKYCPLEFFMSLLSLDGISLYSLQFGEDASQINPWLEDPNVHDLSPLIKDFVDTASLIAQLDLIITIDTSIAHLAGAMGKEVWVLLPFVPDWRWFLEREDSPWYSSMRLFRQNKAGNWRGVFPQVKRRLKRVIQGGNALFHVKNIQPSLKVFSIGEVLDLNQIASQTEKAIQLHKEGYLEDAEKIYLQILEKSPTNAESIHFLGVLAGQRGDWNEGIKQIKRSLKIKPDYLEALNNLGIALTAIGNYQEAIEIYQKAISFKFDYASAHRNLGLLLLLHGDFRTGFLEWEWRFKLEQYQKYQTQTPMWDGSDIRGKTIVIWHEQALGDSIQFVRYAIKLKELGALVTLRVSKDLLGLYRECLGKKILIVDENLCNIYLYDYHVSLMCLPRLLQTTLENIPQFSFYISAPNPLREHCILSSPNAFYRIGIVWGSDPQNIEMYKKKYCPPDHFISLLEIDNIHLYSLQIGKDAQQLKPWLGNLRITDLSPLINDFVDTVCLIDQLDLIITIDTAVAHLAGAMGKKVWVLLPFVPDWRWFLERNDSPWYSSMRLFRQSEVGNWESVFLKVKQELWSISRQKLNPTSAIDNNRPNLSKQIELGLQLHNAGRLIEAEQCYQSILQQNTNNAQAWHYLGVLSIQKGNIQQGIERIELALKIQPNFIEALNNLGVTLSEQGREEEAIDYYQRALEIQPNFVEALNSLGIIYSKQGASERAIAIFQKALQIKPDYADALNNLGITLSNQEKIEEAIETYTRAIAIKPNYAEAFNNLGFAVSKQGNLNLAIEYYQRALALNPKYLDVLNNLGIVYTELGKLDLAIEYYQKALNINANYNSALNNLGMVLLLQGDFKNGLLRYESRFGLDKFKRYRTKTPMWDGVCDLQGKNIVIWHEQGYGDSIQFVRYALLISKRGCKITLSVPTALVSLYQTYLLEQFEVLDMHKCNIYQYNFHVPILSLPRLLQMTVENIPQFSSYIFAPPTRDYRYVLAKNNSYRVGIAWGSDKENLIIYRKKYCPVELFIDLLNIEDIFLYSLQVGEDAAQISPFINDSRVYDLSPLINDFVDTASLIAQLDLIITIDTSVAHLAGAMGKPVWVLLPFAPDWRWLLDRHDTPFYPSMRLFRQSEIGDWKGVFNQVKNALFLEIQAQKINELNSLGISLSQQGKLDEAIEIFYRALKLQPDCPDIVNNLGIALSSQEKLEEAIAVYQKAIAIEPNHAQAINNMGFAISKQGKLKEAIECYQRALDLNPNYIDALNNLGIALIEQGNWQDALILCQQAVKIQPKDPTLHYNLAFILLLLGDLRLGFKEYQWRFLTDNLKGYQTSRPLWAGQNLDGKSIVIWYEQGYGDSIQFVRYAMLLKQMGARVIINVPTPLVELFREYLIEKFEVIDLNQCDIYSYDYHIPVISLAHVLETTLETIPSYPFYINSPFSDKCQYRFPDTKSYRIGFVWSSSNKTVAPKKCCSPELFIDLLTLEDIELFSLQLGEDAKQIAPFLNDARVKDLGPLIHDFVDTAALITQLDLVITIDTAIVHLAGAMGKPVWVLLPFAPDWRWLLERDDSPWYPSMRLFRQTQAFDWQGVFQQVKEKLKERKNPNL